MIFVSLWIACFRKCLCSGKLSLIWWWNSPFKELQNQGYFMYPVNWYLHWYQVHLTYWHSSWSSWVLCCPDYQNLRMLCRNMKRIISPVWVVFSYLSKLGNPNIIYFLKKCKYPCFLIYINLLSIQYIYMQLC